MSRAGDRYQTLEPTSFIVFLSITLIEARGLAITRCRGTGLVLGASGQAEHGQATDENEIG